MNLVALEEQEQTTTKNSRFGEIIKIWAEINKNTNEKKQ